MNAKKNLFYFLKRVPSYFLWIFSFLIYRSKRKWCFGSQVAYNGSNTRYLLQELIEKRPDIKAYWVTDNEETYKLLCKNNIPVLKKWSLRGVWFCLTSKVYVYTHGPGDINFSTSGGTFKVNLWHGIGIKNSEYLAHLSWINKKNPIHRIVYPFYCVDHDVVLCTSIPYQPFFSKTFRVSVDRFIYGYYPRTNTRFYKENELKSLLATTDLELQTIVDKIKKHNRTFIYMPTYRNNQSCDILTAARFNLDDLNEVLKYNNDLLILKLHPIDLRKIESCKDRTNILFVKKQIDPYILFPYIHTLITDYSSVYSEFLLYHNSVILFNFDIDEYRSKDQGCYFDYDEYTSGQQAHCYNELKELMQRKGEYPIPCLKDMYYKYWGLCEGKDIIKQLVSRIFK